VQFGLLRDTNTPVMSGRFYEGRSESIERFAIQRYLLIIGKKQNMQVLLCVHFANCEMSILSNDAVHLLLQCVCADRGSP
jgi:hypothetical protein